MAKADNLPRSLPTESAKTIPPTEKENGIKKPEVASEIILENITPQEYAIRLIETVEKNLQERPQTIEDLKKYEPLRELMSQLETSLNAKEKELYYILQKKLGDIDDTTGLYRKDVQNGIIKNEIYSRIKEGNLKETAKNLGLISLDLRALKAVNDASNNHAVGDAYLKRVAKFIRRDFKPKLKALLGEDVKMSISRDGGDEFSVLIMTEKINLNQNLIDSDQNERTAALFKNPEISRIMEETGKINLMEIITELLSKKMGEQIQNIIFLSKEEQNEYDRLKDKINENKELNDNEQTRLSELEQTATDKMRKTFESHINKGAKEGEYMKVPEDFDLRSYVAAGGATLDEIIGREATEEDFKKFNEIEDGNRALEKLMGAFRDKSDQKAYQEKDRQNEEMLDSPSPSERFRMVLASRNEYTSSLTRRIMNLQESLNACLEKNK